MVEELTTVLRRHGVQVTAQRLAVLRAVSEHPHRTADELAEQVRTAIGAISRQAVYDALALLLDKQLIRRIDPPGFAGLYEDRTGDNHHHLICRACQVVVDIDCAVGARPCLTPDKAHGFELDEAEVVYWGLCPACQRAASTPRRATAPARPASPATRPRRSAQPPSKKKK